MMLMPKDPIATIGPKYFPADMNDDDDDDDDDNEETEEEAKEANADYANNSKCKCTEHRCRAKIKSMNKNMSRGETKQN